MRIQKETVLLGEDEAYLFTLKRGCSSEDMDRRFAQLGETVSCRIQTYGAYHDRMITHEFEDGMILDLKYMYASDEGHWEFLGASFGPRDFLLCDVGERKSSDSRLVCGLVSAPEDGVLGDYVYANENDFYIISVRNRLETGH